MLDFVKDESYPYPFYSARASHGTYQITKPPFSKMWRVNYFLDASDAERTALAKLGKGSFDTLEEGIAACNEHSETQLKSK